MSKSQKLFDELREHVAKTSLVVATKALLEWDQQTKLPDSASEFRSDQITHFAGEVHRRQSDVRLGELLEQLSETDLAGDPHSDTGATIREMKREFDKQVKLPASLVTELARTTSRGQQIWVQARKTDDFALFAPTLKKIFELKRQEAEAIGYEDCPYDALLDEFEPRAKTRQVAKVLESLRQELVPLVSEIAASRAEISSGILHRHFPRQAQEEFAKFTTAAVGFDYQRGRLDETHHPFCTELGPYDCRLTTRFDENFFSPAFFGTLHEAGHGMYEQGLRAEYYGLPPGRYCSLGIHESQSRLWENLVGRRLSFWQHFYAEAQDFFPAALQEVALCDFYRAVNTVEPGLIRVEADEATYNLHIILRFQLEQEVINGELDTDDLPAAWNEKYEQYLGITPTNDADGVLQDIHWSSGSVGYFPTYSLGTLFASQLFQCAENELGNLDIMFRSGEFRPLLEWLNRNVHEPGMCYSSSELGKKVTGSPLSHEDLIAQLRQKLVPIYGL
jgi:carboxypeptidase Taq